MKVRPNLGFLKGTIYFRNALTIESTETIEFEAILDRNLQLLLFQFEDCHFCFDVKKFHLCSKDFNDLVYSDNYNGQECTLTYFYIQEMALGEDSIFFVSGVFDIGEGLGYRTYRIHGYFSARREEIRPRSHFWFD